MIGIAQLMWYTTLVAMKVLDMHLDFSPVSALTTIILVAVAGIVAFGHIKKNLLDSAEKALNLSITTSKELRDQVERMQKTSAEEMQLMRSAFSVQERRIYRMEVEAVRRQRQLIGAKTEIGYLEAVVRVFLDDLTKLPAEKKRKVESVLQDLAQYRLHSAQEISDKDEIEETLELYMDRLSSTATLTQSPLTTSALTAAVLAEKVDLL